MVTIDAAAPGQRLVGNPLDSPERLLGATLEILDPTIVVLQGVRMWKWSENVLAPKNALGNHLFECSLAGKRVVVCAFSHPSSYGKKPTRWALRICRTSKMSFIRPSSGRYA